MGRLEKTSTRTRGEMICLHCGGSIEGDGYTLAFHCENAELPLDRECDASILYCDFKEQEWIKIKDRLPEKHQYG